MANRTRAYGNIVWVHGGDYGDQAGNGGVFTAAQKAAVDSVFSGIKSVSGALSVLHTAHWSRKSLASDVTLPTGPFDLEAVYQDQSSRQYTLSGCSHSPVSPAFEIENDYEGDAAGGEPNRRFNWWTMLSGASGYLVPGGLAGQKAIVVANGNSPSDQTFVACAADLAGKNCACYVPPAWSQTTFTIDSTVMSAPYRARWFNLP